MAGPFLIFISLTVQKELKSDGGFGNYGMGALGENKIRNGLVKKSSSRLLAYLVQFSELFRMRYVNNSNFVI